MLGSVPWKTEGQNAGIIRNLTTSNSNFDTNITELGLFVRVLLLYVVYSHVGTRTLGMIGWVWRWGSALI